jgi:CHASE3 domain sensor protein
VALVRVQQSALARRKRLSRLPARPKLQKRGFDGAHMAAAKISLATNGWKWPVPGRVPLLLGISLSLLVAAAIALTVNLTRLRDSSAWVEHTNEVLRQISDVERAFLTAESGERGYLLTGDNSYLESHNRAQVEMSGLLAGLQKLVSDNQAQTERAVQLRPKVDARLAQFKQVVVTLE